jgi:ABC-2 type transport system permease protein
MKQLTQILPYVLIGVLLVVAIRVRQRTGHGVPGAIAAWLAARRDRRNAARVSASPAGAQPPPLLGDAGLVAAREVRERVRGRLFRAGTALLLAAVAAAIVIPVLTKEKAGTQQAGVVGSLSVPLRAAVVAAGRSAGTTVRFVPQAGLAQARDGLRSGRLALVIVDARQVVVNQAATPTGTSATAQLARAVARTLGVDEAVQSAGLTAGQARRLAGAKAVPVTSLQSATAEGARTTSIIGLVLVFLMLTQYNTWTLIGVMEEKSSRVAEVLLAAIRPAQLLGGKVLGIGLVAFAQAALVIGFAAVLAESVGSDVLHGAAPLVLASTLAWLVLGCAFYCWVYAAAGSLAERRDQVQSLILPLSLPIIAGYFIAQTALAAGTASTLVKVLAYLPPTAPFTMPVLVGLGAVAWWQFALSVLLTAVSTVAVARLATGIYRRAMLRTGSRVPLREVLPGLRRPAPRAG